MRPAVKTGWAGARIDRATIDKGSSAMSSADEP